MTLEVALHDQKYLDLSLKFHIYIKSQNPRHNYTPGRITSTGSAIMPTQQQRMVYITPPISELPQEAG